jgi:putative SOS response-associated peptidase YedK
MHGLTRYLETSHVCGRYLTKRQKQEIAEKMRAKKVFTEPLVPNFNIAPTTFQPIVRNERDSTEREMLLARWGLVPYFATSLTDWRGFSTINARAETIQSSKRDGASFLPMASMSGRRLTIPRSRRNSPMSSH